MKIGAQVIMQNSRILLNILASFHLEALQLFLPEKA